MAPSRSATSITWSLGTNRNSASLSTNFLISQGQATRSTLTCSRVIHFIAFFSFLNYRILCERNTTRNNDWLLHLAFFIHRDAATWQEDVKALSLCIVGSRMRSCLGGDLLINCHGGGVDHVDESRVVDGNIEPRGAVIVPDGIRHARNRHPGQFAASHEV